MKYYQKSIINLESPEALNALGHAHYSLYEIKRENKDLEVAEKYYKRAMEKNPAYTVAIFNLGVLRLETNRTKEAIAYFKSCLEQSQTLETCQIGLIKAYYLNN